MEGQAQGSVKYKTTGSATSAQPLQPRVLSSLEDDSPNANGSYTQPKSKARRSRNEPTEDSTKRRCISTACVACRKRKSKCDGNTPSCAACASVYGTSCVYEPNSDHRRKGVYKKDTDTLKTRSSTLQTLISAILNYPQDEVSDLVRQIRACESLDKMADAIVTRENGDLDQEMNPPSTASSPDNDAVSFERQLYSKVGELRLEDGSVRFIGGTSNLLYDDADEQDDYDDSTPLTFTQSREQIISSWTTVDIEPDAILHLLNLYFTWHYPFFTVLSQSSFWSDFNRGNAGRQGQADHCSSLLVNVMLALGCHFSSLPHARSSPEDSATAGDHFFQEAKRLINEGDEYEKPKMTTVQALALMSVREAGCAREAKGWVYSGISFRMACDLGINFETEGLVDKESAVDEEEEDVRRVTFWGCFLVDKCWSNYLGRLPLFQASNNITSPKFNVIPKEDAEIWSPYTDSGSLNLHSQPSRIRAVALQLSSLCDISGDLMKSFYHPQDRYPSRQAELNRLSDIHTRLETWRRNLPQEMEAREGSLPNVLVMHMFFQLLHIHLFRPFLKYSPTNSPLPSHVSPRKLCTNAAGAISKLLRLYKRSYGLRQILNISVYIAHSACTIHLLNLPDKNAARDITHGVRHLEEIADGWLCARRTLRVLSLQARKWHIDLPEDAAQTLARTDNRYGLLGSPKSSSRAIEKHQDSQRSLMMPSTSEFQGLRLQSPWSIQPSNDPLSSLMSSDLPSATNTCSSTSQQQSPQNLSLVGLPNSHSGIAIGKGQGHQVAASKTQDVTASYLSLLQQQKAWSEAAARNGIPAVSSLGQAGVHQAAPVSLSLPTDRDDANQDNGYNFSNRQHVQAVNRMSLDSGSTMHPPEAQFLPNTSHTSAAGQPHVLDSVGANTSSEQQILGETPTSSLTGPETTSVPQAPTQPQKRKTRKSYGSMFGGVEALLREAQDWWVEDQAQFASGFSNWNASTQQGSTGPGGLDKRTR